MARKSRNKLLCVLLTFCMVGVASACITACTSNDLWNISSSSKSSVTAKLMKAGDGYSLRITGNGSMKDFASANDVPWHESAGKIRSVTVGNGINSIGANAFAGLNVESIILPDSVTYVGANAVGAEGSLFVYHEEIEYADEDLNYVYLYQENVPKTTDRYWQSDKSSGDIFEKQEDLTATNKNYWHFNDE